MPDEVTFLDLACLMKISQDTTLEKIGSAINASIFDASNIAGSLKQKGLIDFSAYYPGPTTITVTDAGKALLAEAEAKATEPFDVLDSEILSQLSGGKRSPTELQNTLSLRPKDLALRIYKLYKQGFLTYELKSGGAEILLTDAGFLRARTPAMQKPQQEPSQPQAQMAPPQNSMPSQSPESATAAGAPMGDAAMPQAQKKGGKTVLVVLVVILIIIIVGGLYYLKMI